MPFYHPSQRTRVVRTTAYTHSERDHLAYGPRNAVGTSLKYTSSVRSAAADWSVYPLGTTFRIKGQPYLYVVDDYGSALVGTGTIDIYQPSKKLMKDWGRRYVELTIVRWGDPANSLEVLSGRRGYKHCRTMYAGPSAPRVQGPVRQGRQVIPRKNAFQRSAVPMDGGAFFCFPPRFAEWYSGWPWTRKNGPPSYRRN